MANINFKLRALLLDIENQLSDSNITDLCFLLGDDVPRRVLDACKKDQSMREVWETLFSCRKITPDNVTYLIERFEQINRMDLAARLRQFCHIPFSSTVSTVPTRTPSSPARATTTNELFYQRNPPNSS
ncbi:unnamed protein product [Didymodactylos carnosus]|uniref:DED domain-containing protein n=1 Tax=Didymodactylos carnosus TaxID=1234261 RepID=A0A8S2HIW6_9BILA|nr:unnamed protein product [Didymodactylos carnosus]CAF3654134.1 unnamed protein product [Didymodactylos carnosus]